jgi:hypothetical protein
MSKFDTLKKSLVPVTLAAVAACSGGGSSKTPDAGVAIDAAPDAAPDARTDCLLGASCIAVDKSCAGLVDNSAGPTFGLRMSQITFSKPAALATGLFVSIVNDAVTPKITSCNLAGNGTWAWLMQFDPTAGTLKIGGALPIPDPTTGYTFDDETIQSFHVQPTVYTTPVARGAGFETPGASLTMPLFLDNINSNTIIAPVEQLKLRGTLSATGNCIGTYNADRDPTMFCKPNPAQPGFIADGSGDGYFSLEVADTFYVAALDESLCVLLSNDRGTYGDGASPEKCKRDALDKIVFQGDWCSATNTAAGLGCADALSTAFTYAASSIKILN